MKIHKFARILGLFLAVGVTLVSASEKAHVKAGSELALNIRLIDSTVTPDVPESEDPQLAARRLIHSALGASMSAGMTWERKIPVQVSMKITPVPRAAKDLRSGACVAIIVIGNSVPADLFKGELVVLKATTQGRDLNTTFYLLGHPSRDPALNTSLGNAFEHAVKSQTLQEAIAGKAAAAAGITAATR